MTDLVSPAEATNADPEGTGLVSEPPMTAAAAVSGAPSPPAAAASVKKAQTVVENKRALQMAAWEERKRQYDTDRLLQLDSNGIPVASYPILEYAGTLGLSLEAVLKTADVGRLNTAVRSWFKGENLSRPSVMEGAALLVQWYDREMALKEAGKLGGVGGEHRDDLHLGSSSLTPPVIIRVKKEKASSVSSNSLGNGGEDGRKGNFAARERMKDSSGRGSSSSASTMTSATSTTTTTTTTTGGSNNNLKLSPSSSQSNNGSSTSNGGRSSSSSSDDASHHYNGKDAVASSSRTHHHRHHHHHHRHYSSRHSGANNNPHVKIEYSPPFHPLPVLSERIFTEDHVGALLNGVLTGAKRRRASTTGSMGNGHSSGTSGNNFNNNLDGGNNGTGVANCGDTNHDIVVVPSSAKRPRAFSSESNLMMGEMMDDIAGDEEEEEEAEEGRVPAGGAMDVVKATNVRAEEKEAVASSTGAITTPSSVTATDGFTPTPPATAATTEDDDEDRRSASVNASVNASASASASVSASTSASEDKCSSPAGTGTPLTSSAPVSPADKDPVKPGFVVRCLSTSSAAGGALTPFSSQTPGRNHEGAGEGEVAKGAHAASAVMQVLSRKPLELVDRGVEDLLESI